MMLHPTYEPAAFRAEAALQQGPVLVATKPFVGMDEPIRVARWLAHREERTLRIVSVLEQHEALALAAGCPPLSLEHYASERALLAAQLRNELEADGEDPARLFVDVIDGESTAGIVEMAKRCGARVIVVGTGRHDAIGRFVYGERALRVLAAADRPVLVVPRGADAGAVSVVTVAVDFGDECLRAARAVLPMMSAGGRLVLMHVNTEVDSRLNQKFAAFRRALPTVRGISVENHIVNGDVVRSILAFATSIRSGLIACGRTSHSLFERAWVGSVSSALVRKASCPVLVTPGAA